MSSKYYHFKENSQLYIKEYTKKNENGKDINLLEIMIMRDNNQMYKIGEIPRPEQLEELDDYLRDPNQTRLVTYNYNQGQPETTLYFFSVDLKEGSIKLDKSIITKYRPRRIYPGIYFYEDQYGQPCLADAYYNKITLTRCFPDLVQEIEIEIDGLEDGVKEPTQENTLKYPNIKELRVSIGLVETLHLLIKLPTKPNEEFLVFKIISSRMTGLEYTLWDDKENFKYLSHNLQKAISETELYKEIISRTYAAIQEEKDQNARAKLRLLQRLKPQQQS